MKHARGQAALETAIVGLLFATMVIGLVEAGRAVWQYNTLAQATREGVRYAIVHGSRSSDPSGPGSAGYTPPDQDVDVIDVVRDHASGLDLADLAVSTEWLDGTNERGSRVKVTSRYEFAPVIAQFFGMPSITLSSSSVMRITH